MEWMHENGCSLLRVGVVSLIGRKEVPNTRDQFKLGEDSAKLYRSNDLRSVSII
jgi:hypothetical protein